MSGIGTLIRATTVPLLPAYFMVYRSTVSANGNGTIENDLDSTTRAKRPRLSLACHHHFRIIFCHGKYLRPLLELLFFPNQNS